MSPKTEIQSFTTDTECPFAIGVTVIRSVFFALVRGRMLLRINKSRTGGDDLVAYAGLLTRDTTN